MSDHVQRKNVSDVVAAKIKDYIIEHGLKAGDRLPTEHEFAERFGVSRISVREATKSLGFLGIIDAAPRRGLSIGHLNMDRISQYLGFHFAITEYPLEQLVRTRIAIELGGLPVVVERMKAEPDVYRELTELNKSLQASQSMDDWIQRDIAFHRGLLSASGLEPLVAFHDLLQVFFHRFRERMDPSQWELTLHDHQQILDEAHAGNLQGACDAMRRHIERNLERDADEAKAARADSADSASSEGG